MDRTISKISFWNPEEAFNRAKNFTMYINGPRRSGKSYLIEHLYKTYLRNRFDLVIVFCETIDLPDLDSNKEKFGYITENSRRKVMKFSEYNEDIIDSLLETQKEDIIETGNPHNVLIIFDDTVNSEIKNSRSLGRIYRNGRHYGISFIYATQDPVQGASSANRGNIDFVISFFQPSRKEFLLDNFFKGSLDSETKKELNMTEKVFMSKLYDMATEDHKVLVCDITTGRHKLQDMIYIYKAP